jgi:CPA1 family monovalent cation:H+ antiporter
MTAVLGLVWLGRRLQVAYPIVLVIGGLGIALVPNLPEAPVDPELVFFLVLPPLLYAAAWFTSWHDFKLNLRPILLLAVGLVLFTTVIVGLVIHALIPGIPLAVAFALGAIISPPDAVATAAIAQRMRLPKRLITVLEGESLINDATGLVALRFALAAAGAGGFSLGAAAWQFVLVAAGGVLLGLAVALVLEQVMRRIHQEPVAIMVSLLAPYLAYLPAEQLHVSGVLACVAAGLRTGWKAPEWLAARTRLSGAAVWETLVFLLNCAVFILIGLQLPAVRRDLGHHTWGELALYGAVTSGLVIIIRPVWVFPATWLPRLLSRRVRERDPLPPWRNIVILSWAGMRGVVSLAAALALPRMLPNGQPFPERDLIVFLTFCVILATLVLQGLSLPWLIRRLRVHHGRDPAQEREARTAIAQAALKHLEKLAEKDARHPAAAELVTSLYRARLRHLNDTLAHALGWSGDQEQLVTERRFRREGLEAERRELIRLHRHHAIDEDLMHRIERELDLEEARLRAVDGND